MPELIQINISVKAEDAAKIDEMMSEDAIENRSAFVRRLVRLEWAKRHAPAKLEAVEATSSAEVIE